MAWDLSEGRLPAACVLSAVARATAGITTVGCASARVWATDLAGAVLAAAAAAGALGVALAGPAQATCSAREVARRRTAAVLKVTL